MISGLCRRANKWNGTLRLSAITLAGSLLAHSLLAGQMSAGEVPAGDGPSRVRGGSVRVQGPPLLWKHNYGKVDLRLTVNATRLRVADPLRVTLDVWTPRDAEVEFATWGQQLGPFTVLDIQASDDVPVNGRRHWQRRLHLECLLPGTHTLPSLTVTWTLEGGGGAAAAAPITGQTPQVDIAVESQLGEAEVNWDFRDQQPPVEMPDPGTSRIGWWAAGGGVLATALLLAIWRWRTVRRDRSRIPPWQVAWQTLDALDAERDRGLPAEVGSWYARLTHIVRVYLEQQFDIRAPCQTTAEFLDIARQHPRLRPAERELLERFLTEADLVKFAAGRPAAGDIEAAVATARRFIRLTSEQATPSADHAHGGAG